MIYVHVPFCRNFCTYCDFYSEVAARCRKAEDILKQEKLFEEFSQALCAEAVSRAGEISDEVNTLYIGGGTPSVLPLSAFRALAGTLKALRLGASGSDLADASCPTSGRREFEEFTVEVNPEDIIEKGHEYVEGLLELGVNRISMGVQSFDDKILRFMNRRHSSEDAVKAYGILEEAGVRNISIDLIFGLPQLSLDQWKNTLDKALNISSRGTLPQHVSSYQLSVEPGSMLARFAEKGVWSEASDEVCQEQYSALCEALASAGYHHYEISNFALPGYEAVHNSAYWRHVPYVGLGPGAHGFSPLDASRQWNADDLQAYLDAYRNGDFSAIREGETLTREQLVLEHIMLGLRTSAGLPADYLRAHCEPAAFDRALDSGDLQAVPGSERLRIPESRFFVSDSIISSLV
ncbi:MAG: radical SAM family heme chaperone HemW [Bacteroidales bacterium]|nr:radical SAM family heme chaperone HemW [Bacteroidales bacterium]